MNILFVCSGNTCRSPLAEALMRHKVLSLSAVHAPEIQIKSAGTSATPNQPMALAMELILQERGIDSTHHSQRWTWELLAWADVILTMTQAQKTFLQSQVPPFASKLATLNNYAGNRVEPDIDDPYGCDLDSYRQCARQIETACDGLLRRLLKKSFPNGGQCPPYSGYSRLIETGIFFPGNLLSKLQILQITPSH
jgi:protein-tyrosine-phosphatase